MDLECESKSRDARVCVGALCMCVSAVCACLIDDIQEGKTCSSYSMDEVGMGFRVRGLMQPNFE